MAKQIKYLKLSQPQHTPAGDALRAIYYRTRLCDLFDHDHRSGYPHNGGEHSLVLFQVDADDVAAWLDLVDETMGEKALPFTIASRERLTAATIH